MSNRTDAPELIDLPVYRDDYISQQQVDLLCRLLWKECPYYIRDLVAEENVGRRKSPMKIYCLRQLFGRICRFFREVEESHDGIYDISYIGMVDLVYEVERRVRIALGLEDLKPIGHPIAPTPQGPFPEIMDIDYHVLKDEESYREYPAYKDKVEPKLSPERNELYHRLREEHPEVVFAYAEGIRRCQSGNEAEWFFDIYIDRHLPKDYTDN